MESDNEMQPIKRREYKTKLDTISLLDDNEDEKKDASNPVISDDKETKLLTKKEQEVIEDEKHNIAYVFKIILIGDTNTGKTTICNTLMHRKLKMMQYQPTIGIDFNSLIRKIFNNVNVKVQLWDTAGQEKYRSIITSYYRNICAAIVTYDVTNRTSFMRVINWINELNRFNTCKHDYRHPILVLGTKSDLNKDRKVSFEEAFQFADKNGLIFREVNSFVFNGPLNSGFTELLQTIYSMIEYEKNEYIKRIPVAEPYPSYTENLTINLQPNAIQANIETEIIGCKGVKYLQDINTLELRNLSPTINESPKICSKCIIS